jgi:predicted O-methyltransferase YrrM
MNEILKQIPTAWTEHITFAEWLVKRKNPETIVDLGVDYGYSTFCFALPNIGTVYGIDSFEGDPQAGVKNTYEYVKQKKRELGLKNIIFIKGYFGLVAKQWNKSIDILHIDGFHSYDAVKKDYETWKKFVKDDGVILFHDTCVEQPGYGVRQFFNELNLPKINFTCSHGLGVVSNDENLINEIKNTFENLDT